MTSPKISNCILGSPLTRCKSSRRDFIKLMGVAGAALSIGPLLAACNPGIPAAETVESISNDQIGGAIDFLSWEGYDLQAETEAWRKEHGVTMNSTYIGSMEGHTG